MKTHEWRMLDEENFSETFIGNRFGFERSNALDKVHSSQKCSKTFANTKQNSRKKLFATWVFYGVQTHERF